MLECCDVSLRIVDVFAEVVLLKGSLVLSLIFVLKVAWSYRVVNGAPATVLYVLSGCGVCGEGSLTRRRIGTWKGDIYIFVTWAL